MVSSRSAFIEVLVIKTITELSFLLMTCNRIHEIVGSCCCPGGLNTYCAVNCIWPSSSNCIRFSRSSLI